MSGLRAYSEGPSAAVSHTGRASVHPRWQRLLAILQAATTYFVSSSRQDSNKAHIRPRAALCKARSSTSQDPLQHRAPRTCQVLRRECTAAIIQWPIAVSASVCCLCAAAAARCAIHDEEDTSAGALKEYQPSSAVYRLVFVTTSSGRGSRGSCVMSEAAGKLSASTRSPASWPWTAVSATKVIK